MKTLFRFISLVSVCVGLIVVSGCASSNPSAVLSPTDCEPFTKDSFFGPPKLNPAWRHGGGLMLGDIKAKRLAATRVLKAPTGWDCPDRLDNSGYCTPLENQGNNPWCAAYSMAQLLQASYWREFHSKTDFPEGVIYSEAKRRDGLPGDGTTLEAVQSAVLGVDYGIGYRVAMDWEQVFEVEDVLFAVHKYGLVMVGMQITQGWDRTNVDGSIGNATGTMGGHAVLVSGYSKSCNAIWGPNWWGKAWGKNGWWYMTLDQFREQFGYGYALRIKWEENAPLERSARSDDTLRGVVGNPNGGGR